MHATASGQENVRDSKNEWSVYKPPVSPDVRVDSHNNRGQREIVGGKEIKYNQTRRGYASPDGLWYGFYDSRG